jgi:hypothetical protein
MPIYYNYTRIRMKRAMNLTKIILGHPSKADKMKEG